MTQTNDAISGAAAHHATSTDGTTFADRSGYSARVTPGSQSRMTGEAYTFEGDTAVVTYGNREPMDIVVSGIYTEDVSSYFEAARAAFEANTLWVLQWAPAGSEAGNFQYTTDLVYSRITEFNWPEVDASSGDPVMFEYTVHTPGVTKSVISS